MEVEGLDYAQVTPEVDAVCDVAPVSDYENWVLDNYGWVNVWNGEVTGKDAAATRFEYEYDGHGLAIGVISSEPHISGMSNLACAVLGVDLFEDSGNETLGFKVESFYRDDSGRNTLTLLSHVPLDSSCGIVVKGTSNLADKWRTIPATIESSEYDAERGFVRTTFIAEDDKCRFFKLAIE